MSKAIGMVEYKTVSTGMTAADNMVKTSNVEILQALLNVSGKAAGKGHDLTNCVDMGTFQGHSPGHDQADVTGA